MKISVIGLGYVGLPLALLIAEKGFTIIGVDKKQDVVDSINNGVSHIKDPFLDEIIKKVKIKARTNIEESDIYIICVPTPINITNKPDLTYVIDATKEVSNVINDNELVIIESTIYPGTCEEIVKPLLDKSGKKYLLTHCPERINPGDTKWNIGNIPRVVGGMTREATEKARQFYVNIIDADVVPLSQIKAAEATKILENTFRDVNIAFINEMAQSFYKLGIDIKEVIKGASTKPFGFMPHYPGVGVGGHCIAVDPYYMIERGKEAGFHHDFLSQARRINSHMPYFTVKIIQDELNLLGYPLKGTDIALLGVAYKPEIDDDRESPFHKVYQILSEQQAVLHIFDPYIPKKSNVATLEEALKKSVCAVIITAHKIFLKPKIYKEIKLVVDGRNCLDKNEIKAIGVVYKGIGIR